MGRSAAAEMCTPPAGNCATVTSRRVISASPYSRDMRVYAVVGYWSFEDDEGRITGESHLFEVFVNERDAKKYVADQDGKTADDFGLGYSNITLQSEIYFEIEHRQLRTGWAS